MFETKQMSFCYVWITVFVWCFQLFFLKMIIFETTEANYATFDLSVEYNIAGANTF